MPKDHLELDDEDNYEQDDFYVDEQEANDEKNVKVDYGLAKIKTKDTVVNDNLIKK